MIGRELEVSNAMGLHARAAARLVTLLKGYRSEVWLYRPNATVRVDARSIICLLGMGASCGTRLHCDVSGPDEAETLDAVQSLFDSRFGENG